MVYKQPDRNGFYGRFGGRFVPETLMTAVLELEEAYRESQADPSFQAELDQLLKQYVGRETPLYYAKNLTKYVGGAKIFLKREDLNHTGAHKINKCPRTGFVGTPDGQKEDHRRNRGRTARCCNSNSCCFI